MMNPYNLIIADDDITVRQLLELKSIHYGFKPKVVSNGAEVLEALHDEVEVILIDLYMPVMDGFETLKALAKAKNNVPVIMLSGEHEAQVAIKAVKLGAMDYISKPFDLDELFTTLRNAKKLFAVQKENTILRAVVSAPVGYNGLLAHSLAMKDIQRKCDKIAKFDTTVLLTGESGTGKGVIARYIHSKSLRADQPFVTISCPALPRELLESELFGHEKGAFTGAMRKHIGKIESAKGGTIFLDEIGDLPIDLQPKLLNVLQDQEFCRIGGEKVLKADVRIIAATNINFKDKIQKKEFREDLYYRLSVIPMEIPPLRDRAEEILPLAKHFVTRIAKRLNLGSITISKSATTLLKDFSWPGNVRQLENYMERAAALCDESTIKPEDLGDSIYNTTSNKQISDIEDHSSSFGKLAGHTLVEIESEAIRQTLEHCKGNKAESARRLGITEKTIYNKIKKLNIHN